MNNFSSTVKPTQRAKHEMTDTHYLKSMLRWVYKNKATGRFFAFDKADTTRLSEAFVDSFRAGFHDPLSDSSTISELLWGSCNEMNPFLNPNYERVYLDSNGREVPGRVVSRLVCKLATTGM